MTLFLAIRNLFRNTRRTLAIALTIGLGTGALFAFDGFINGVLGELRTSTIHSNYGYGQINTAGYRDSIYEDPTNHWITNADEIEQVLMEMDEVEDLFRRTSFSALITSGSITVSGSGQGVDAAREANFFHSMNIEEGETLSTQANGILLGRGLANALNVAPGDTVTVMATATHDRVSKEEFVVTGIFHTGTQDFDNRVFRIQLAASQKLLEVQRVELISLALRDIADWNAVQKRIEQAFPDLEATPFHELDKIYYQHSVDWLKAQFNIVQIIILTIVLLGIFNAISTSILERKQEIGNLRANGESSTQVMRLIATEGALLAVVGSVLGMALTYGILTLFIDKGLLMPPGPGQTRQFLVSFSFEWSMALYALGVSTLAAAFASLLAALKVTRMPIAAALRA